MKVCKVSGSNTPLFLNVGTRWRRVVSFKLWLFYSQVKKSSYPPNVSGIATVNPS
jgi:hypothetical protein